MSALAKSMPLTAELYVRDDYGEYPDEAVWLNGWDLLEYEDKIRNALVQNRMPDAAPLHLQQNGPLGSFSDIPMYFDRNISGPRDNSSETSLMAIGSRIWRKRDFCHCERIIIRL